jgi:hypothetical protein
MDLEEMLANLGVELALKNMFIYELKRTTEEENKKLIRKEKLKFETNLAVCAQVIQELQAKKREKSRVMWAVFIAVILVLAIMWLW